MRVDDLGYSVDCAGDVNGDGVADVMLGALGVDISGHANAGATYVIFGKNTATNGPFSAVIDLTELDGSNGFTIGGIADYDNVGYYLAGIGDANGDDYDDMLVAAGFADPNNLVSAGQTYVVYGAPSFGATFELASLLSANGGDGMAGYAINGFMAGQGARYIAGVGDVNDDGYADLRVAASGVDVGYTDAGQAYIVYGKPMSPGIRVMPAGGLSTTESGGTAAFNVVLTTPPGGGRVTIPVSTSDPSEGTVAVSSLMFTSANWTRCRPVTINRCQRQFNDGDVAYTIVLGAAIGADVRNYTDSIQQTCPSPMSTTRSPRQRSPRPRT